VPGINLTMWYMQQSKQCSVPDYWIIIVQHGSANPEQWVL
jgi:hypothetical protein